jgi:UDP-glucose 4-epimerase
MFNIVEACRYRGVKKVVFSSSVATFGDPEADAVDETTPFRWHTAPPALALYASSKIIGENLLRLYKQRHGLDYVALRYSTVYGERQHHRGVNALHIIESYERIKQGERPVIPGDGTEAHDYVYVGDVARANVTAMASEVSGESFLIATGVDTSVNQIVDILLRLTNSPLKPRRRDDPGQVRTTTKASLGFSPAKAKRMLGWEAQTGIEEGIGRLIAWAEGSNRP